MLSAVTQKIAVDSVSRRQRIEKPHEGMLGRWTHGDGSCATQGSRKREFVKPRLVNGVVCGGFNARNRYGTMAGLVAYGYRGGELAVASGGELSSAELAVTGGARRSGHAVPQPSWYHGITVS